MASKSAQEVLGFEYDWLASDAAGHVALFSTAGGGLVPDEVLADVDAHDEAIDLLIASPASTTARFSPTLSSEFTNTWRLVAERGLFAFDSDAEGGPYRLVASPQAPSCLAELPDRVAATARKSW